MAALIHVRLIHILLGHIAKDCSDRYSFFNSDYFIIIVIISCRVDSDAPINILNGFQPVDTQSMHVRSVMVN